MTLLPYYNQGDGHENNSDDGIARWEINHKHWGIWNLVLKNEYNETMRNIMSNTKTTGLPYCPTPQYNKTISGI